ncbi:MAG: hypothetical protein ABI240_10435, partial [Sphingomonas sp.]
MTPSANGPLSNLDSTFRASRPCCPMARPTHYKPDFARQAHLLCRLGLENADLAQAFSVSPATLYRWLNQYPEFASAAAAGKALSASPVQTSLYRRAIGGDYLVERVYRPRGASQPVVAHYRRRILADPQAALRWLRNRRPETWRLSEQSSNTAMHEDRQGAQPERKKSYKKSDSHNPTALCTAEETTNTVATAASHLHSPHVFSKLTHHICLTGKGGAKTGAGVVSHKSPKTLRFTFHRPLLASIAPPRLALFRSLRINAGERPREHPPYHRLEEA